MKYLFVAAVSGVAMVFTIPALAAGASVSLPQVSGKPVDENSATPLALEVEDAAGKAAKGPAVLNSKVTEFGRATALTQPLVRPQADGELPKTDDVAVPSESKNKKPKSSDLATDKGRKKTKNPAVYNRKTDIAPTEDDENVIK